MAYTEQAPRWGALYIVPTPIGNIRDITLRALDVLGEVDIIAAEDTRRTSHLLQSLGISTNARVVSYYDHNELSRSAELLEALKNGKDVALVSDAGTPLINDPGFRLVSLAIVNGVRVLALPGPCAPVTALVASGLASHRFHYVGFLPRQRAARRTSLTALRALPDTLIFFEAPHRVLTTLDDILEIMGDRPAAVARNVTKADEEYVRGKLSEIHAALAARERVRGELTLVIAGIGERQDDEQWTRADRGIEALLARGLDTRLIREVVSDLTGLPRNQVYGRITERRTTQRLHRGRP